MPRPLRTGEDGDVFHVTTRGNRQGLVFMDDADRILLAAFLKRTIPRYGWICHAFAFLGNHFHLLIETPTFNLSAGMQYVCGRYGQSFNQRHGHIGHVFQGRFKSKHVMSDEHFLECSRYIELNAVRAGLVRRPDAWPWSSYRATAGLGRRPAFLTVDTVLELFDADVRRARAAYRRFVADGLRADMAGV